MTREELIATLSQIKKKASFLTRKAISKIIILCEDYRLDGRKFTFDTNSQLDKQVNRLLIQLSDELMKMTTDKADEIVEEKDRDEIYPVVFGMKGDMDAVQRFDNYSSHLKYFLEAYIAIGFANQLQRVDIQREILRSIHDPFNTPFFINAYNKGGYYSNTINNKGYQYGKGTTKDILDGFTLTSQGILNEAYQRYVIINYRKDKNIIGYNVRRGSSYHCDYCDSLCEVPHTLEEIVLPAHPRCMCYTVPIYADK